MALVSLVFLTTMVVTSRADESPGTRERFLELDREIQAIKSEILEIDRDIHLLREMSQYSAGEQLVVFISVATNSAITPDRITLKLDGQTVTQYDYSKSEKAALLAGGVHRLYTGALSTGAHRLELFLSGAKDRAGVPERHHTASITKTPGRTYMELQLESPQLTSEAGVTVREWKR